MRKNNKIEIYLESRAPFGLLLLRLFLGLRLIYGVADNVFSWEKMAEFSHFLDVYHFPMPLISAILSVVIQFIGGILLLLGFQTRMASALLVVNFIIALLFVHLASGDTVEGMTPALAMLFGCLCLFFTGAGRYSMDVRRRALAKDGLNRSPGKII